MACPRCGEHCLCNHAGDFAGIRLSVADVIPSTRERQMGFIQTSVRRAEQKRAEEAAANQDPEAWRNEIASRVQAHKAKRRRKHDAESSMSLGFEGSAFETSSVAVEEEVAYHESEDSAVMTVETAVEEPLEEQSHTFDVMAAENAEPAYEPPLPPAPAPNIYDRMAARAAEARKSPVERDSDNNIIEFPKPAAPQSLFAEELAEPISPRILDVPDETHEPQMNVPAPVASVMLDEPAGLPEWAQNYQEDEDDQIWMPLQVAPFGPRLLCAVMDFVLVLTASALFSLIVLSVAKFVPQGKSAAAIAVLLPAFFWAAYHYVFLVFGGVTPGMLMTQLELSTFEGCVPLRRTRATRAIALLLSCASLGLGFAWAVLDEDNLGWHDRITRTYLRLS